MSSDNKLSGTPSHAMAFHGATWRVVCLCAAWCGVCRQYASDFQSLQTKYPHVHFDWVDVEDREDLLGDVDVETFPTLLVGCGDTPLFLGPLLPQIKVLDKLLASLQEGPRASASLPSEALPLWLRVVAQSQ